MSSNPQYKKDFLNHFNETILTHDPYNNVGRATVSFADASQAFHDMLFEDSREYKDPYPFHTNRN